MEEERIQEFIRRAEAFYGDLLGEYASYNHEDQGGINGMIEGRFELDDGETVDCMFEAISMIQSPAVLLLTDNERHEIVDYWKKRDYV